MQAAGFRPPRGSFVFYPLSCFILCPVLGNSFRPPRGSFVFYGSGGGRNAPKAAVFVPLGGLLFSIKLRKRYKCGILVFVPLGGLLFSIGRKFFRSFDRKIVFVPLGGLLFSMIIQKSYDLAINRFRPPRGSFVFY